MQFLKSYLPGLTAAIKTVEQVQRMYEPINAYRFNLFNFWHPGENKLSEILSFFLDPKEAHGQGDTFLKIFLEVYKLDQFITSFNHIQVKCEHAITNQRRIDIFLHFYADNFVIAIENKFGAGDQQNQLRDYAAYLTKFKRFVLFYLTPAGVTPSEGSISKGDYELHFSAETIRPLSYKSDIIELINRWSIACRAERIRHFLNDFEQYFKQELMGESFSNEHKIVADYAMSTPENLKAAFETFKAFDTIKDEIGNRFGADLASRLRSHYTAAEWTVEHIKLVEVVVSNANWPKNTFVGVRDYDRDRLHFSVKNDDIGYEALYDFVKGELDGQANTKTWWRKLDYPYNCWDDNIEALLKLYDLNEQLFDDIIDEIKKVVQSTERYFALNRNLY